MRLSIIGFAIALAACSSDADKLGVGAECTANEDCRTDLNQTCLMQFAGGYCGIQGCQGDADCPEDAACVAPGDGNNYCFRICIDKVDCNANRTVDNESNCSANITFISGAQGRKACIPPSGT